MLALINTEITLIDNRITLTRRIRRGSIGGEIVLCGSNREEKHYAWTRWLRTAYRTSSLALLQLNLRMRSVRYVSTALVARPTALNMGSVKNAVMTSKHLPQQSLALCLDKVRPEHVPGPDARTPAGFGSSMRSTSYGLMQGPAEFAVISSLAWAQSKHRPPLPPTYCPSIHTPESLSTLVGPENLSSPIT